MNLVIDVGNTNIKVGIFNGKKIVDKFIFPKNSDFASFYYIDTIFDAAILSGSGDINISLWNQIQAKNKTIFSNDLKSKIKTCYETPETLGQDRWLNAYAAINEFPNTNTLILDLGTCLTITMVDDTNTLLGGSISPGMNIRAKSLNYYTEKLPLIDMHSFKSGELGKNTIESIWSGVYYSLCYEIDSRIDYYNSKFDKIKVLLTGGDLHFFENRIKNKIFADSNLTLKGLNYILLE